MKRVFFLGIYFTLFPSEYSVFFNFVFGPIDVLLFPDKLNMLANISSDKQM